MVLRVTRHAVLRRAVLGVTRHAVLQRAVLSVTRHAVLRRAVLEVDIQAPLASCCCTAGPAQEMGKVCWPKTAAAAAAVARKQRRQQQSQGEVSSSEKSKVIVQVAPKTCQQRTIARPSLAALLVESQVTVTH